MRRAEIILHDLGDDHWTFSLKCKGKIVYGPSKLLPGEVLPRWKAIRQAQHWCKNFGYEPFVERKYRNENQSDCK
jgi:hypothetical protein